MDSGSQNPKEVDRFTSSSSSSEMAIPTCPPRLGFRSTENPDGKYDWLQRGGRFDGYLKLKTPKPAGWLRRLRGRGPTTAVNEARKSDVVVERILEDPPFALVVDGVWHDAGWEDDSSWPERFSVMFEQVPDDALLQVVDAHC